MDDPTSLTNPAQTWSWGDVPTDHQDVSESAPPDAPDPAEPETAQSEVEDDAEAAAPNQSNGRKYKARSCRICFEEVQPTFESPGTTTQFLGQKPRVRYISEDPDFGRLMSPCKCRGSQKYVHEGCLRAWRMASPSNRNMWECPTCKFQYQLQRLTWGRWASSKLVRAGVTLLIMVLSVFLLGFVADPIIRLGSSGPISFLADLTTDVFDEFEELGDWLPDEQPDTWSWHFTRGFMALGFTGLLKSFITLRPWQWWHIRVGGGARRARGRDRFDNINMAMVLLGVATFMMAVWKGVSALSARFLEGFSDTIIDVPDADEDEDGDEDGDEDARPRPESRKDQ